MIGVAAGLCHEGLVPVAISYAPFVTGRVFDQIKACIGAMGLPLVLVGSASGLSKGDLGPELMCMDDIALLRTIPDMAIISPADAVEVTACIRAAVQAKRPVYIRLTGGRTLPCIYEKSCPFEIGRSVVLARGEKILLITTGAVTYQTMVAAKRLAEDGTPVTVLNMHTVKPLDTEALDRYVDAEYYVTIEEHCAYGGLGSAVAEYLSQKRIHPRLVRLGTPENYFAADLYDNLITAAGLAAEPLYRTLKELL